MKGVNSHDRRDIRKNLCDKYGARCAYCEVSTGLRTGTVDHYVPSALGGTNEFTNLRWSCFDCNHQKGDMSPQEWEQNKPAPRREETRQEKRARLLAGLAQRKHETAHARSADQTVNDEEEAGDDGQAVRSPA